MLLSAQIPVLYDDTVGSFYRESFLTTANFSSSASSSTNTATSGTGTWSTAGLSATSYYTGAGANSFASVFGATQTRTDGSYRATARGRRWGRITTYTEGASGVTHTGSSSSSESGSTVFIGSSLEYGAVMTTYPGVTTTIWVPTATRTTSSSSSSSTSSSGSTFNVTYAYNGFTEVLSGSPGLYGRATSTISYSSDSGGVRSTNLDGASTESRPNIVNYVASTTYSDERGRTNRTTTDSSLDAGTQLVSFHSELFVGNSTAEAFFMTTSRNTGVTPFILGGTEVFAGHYTSFGEGHQGMSTSIAAETVYEVINASDVSAVMTTFEGVQEFVSHTPTTLIFDFYDETGGVTEDAATLLSEGLSLTTSAVTREVPTVIETTWSIGLGSTFSFAAPIPIGVATTTKFRIDHYTFTQLQPVADTGGFQVLRATGSSGTITQIVAGPNTSYRTTSSFSSSSSTSETSAGYNMRRGETGSSQTFAGASARGLHVTYLAETLFPGPRTSSAPLVLRRVALGGVRAPASFSVGSPRYAEVDFEQNPTQYGIAQRPAVLGPLFANTDERGATGGAVRTQTAYSWGALTEPWSGVGGDLEFEMGILHRRTVVAADKPAQWDATAITPCGVFMTASYGESESGPTVFESTFIPRSSRTTQALAGARTVIDHVDYVGPFTTISNVVDTTEWEVTEGMHLLAATTPRFYNNTAEFF